MKTITNLLILLLSISIYQFGNAQTPDKPYHEPYRPQVHFSPKEHWTNDPNGMVFYKGTYHLFFQCIRSLLTACPQCIGPHTVAFG